VVKEWTTLYDKNKKKNLSENEIRAGGLTAGQFAQDSVHDEKTDKNEMSETNKTGIRIQKNSLNTSARV